MPARGAIVNGELLAELLEKHGVSAYEFSKVAGVSHSMVTRLLHDERTAGRKIRDRLVSGLYRLGESRQTVDEVVPEIPTGRMLNIRKMPGELFSLVKQACRKLRAPNREVLVRPFHKAYPFSPIEVAEAVRTYVGRRSQTFEDFVARYVPGAPTLERTSGGQSTVPVSLAGIPEEWYMAWRVAMARHNRPAADVLAEAFEGSSPFPPGVVVDAAERHAEAEGMTLAEWVSRILGRQPWK